VGTGILQMSHTVAEVYLHRVLNLRIVHLDEVQGRYVQIHDRGTVVRAMEEGLLETFCF
jgi:hypothetical protein